MCILPTLPVMLLYTESIWAVHEFVIVIISQYSQAPS